MNSKLWIHKALTMCLMIALVATYSMVALAGTGKAAGELIVTGNNIGDGTSFVTVNGEAARTGRTIFSSSTISTPEGAGAIVNLGKAGRIEFAPNSTFALTFDSDAISGYLTTGSITVLNAAQSVNVTTLNGELVSLNAGESATAEAGKAAPRDHKDSTGRCIDDDKDGKEECDKDSGILWWALIFGGAAAGIFVAMQGEDMTFGGSSTTVSPTR